MPTALSAVESELQFRLNTQYVPSYAPELAPLSPFVMVWGEPGADCQWLGVMCDHPKYPRSADRFDPPLARMLIRYRVGRHHQWLMWKGGREWTLRRVGLLMRLLLKKTAREVEKARGEICH